MPYVPLPAPYLSETESFAPLLLVVGLAFVVPLLIARVNRWVAFPVVVGEILVGIGIGQLYPSLLEDDILRILAEIGFGVLFFLAGTEIDFSSLRLPDAGRRRREGWQSVLKAPALLGTLIFLATALLAAGSAFALNQLSFLRGNTWPFLILILAPSSLGLIVAVLKERGYADSEVGQLILVSATVADFGTLLALTVAVAMIELGGFEPQVLLVGLIFVGFILIYNFFSRIYQNPSVQRVVSALNSPTAQVKLRFAFALFLIFVVLAETLGAEIVLGTFLAGVVVSLLATPRDREVIHQLESVGFGFFIPIFFIMVGVRFDLQALLTDPSALLLVPLLVVAAIVVKVVPALLLRLVMSWRYAVGSGLLLTARLSLVVAVAAIGSELGSLTAPVSADIILLAMIMALFGPLAFNRVMPRLEEAELPPIIVAGAGELGLEVAEQLRAHHEPVIIIDPDPSRVEAAQVMGFQAIEAHVDRQDARVSDTLFRAERLVTTHAEPDVSYQICRMAREHYRVEHVVARVTSTADLPRFQLLGVTAVNPAIDFAALLVTVTRNPAAYELMTRLDDDKEMHEFTLRNPGLIGRRIQELDLPNGLLLVALRRGGELLVPIGTTRLHEDDHVTVVGDVDAVRHAYELFSSATVAWRPQERVVRP